MEFLYSQLMSAGGKTRGTKGTRPTAYRNTKLAIMAKGQKVSVQLFIFFVFFFLCVFFLFSH